MKPFSLVVSKGGSRTLPKTTDSQLPPSLNGTAGGREEQGRAALQGWPSKMAETTCEM